MHRDTLAQTHPTYDAPLLRELRDLYMGGYEIAARASTYLPTLVGENEARWTERQGAAAFVGYLSHIVDHYASALFSQSIHVAPAEGEPPVDAEFYETFSNDADLASSSFCDVLRGLLTWALVQRRALLAVDFPTVDAEATSRADEDAMGAARAYVYQVPTEQLIDWDYETKVRRREKTAGGVVEYDVGSFAWCVLYTQTQERLTPADKRETLVERWKVWSRDESGRVVWELYEARSKTGAPSTFSPSVERTSTDSQFVAGTSVAAQAAAADVPLVASGVTSFQQIPVLELTVPDGLWIGNKIGPLNKEHWQRRSILNASENRSLVATAYAKLGSEVGAVGSAVVPHVQRDPERGEGYEAQLAAKGYLVIGAQDELGYLEPSGGYAESAENRIGKLVDEMYRVSHLMAASVSSTSNSVGRSGASKAEDRFATTVVLQALGAICRDFARRVYEVMSEARGEVVTWQATGADRFDLFDREQVVAEGVDLAEFPIPSATLEVEYRTQFASRLVPNLAPEVLQQVREEIKAGVEAKRKQAEEARKAALQSPQVPIGDGTGRVARPGDDIVTPQGRGPLRVRANEVPR